MQRIRRRAIWLSLVSAAMFVFMAIGVLVTDHKVLAEKDNFGVLTTRIDQLGRGQDEVKSTLSALQIVVQPGGTGLDQLFINWLKQSIRARGGSGPNSVQRALGQVS